MGYQPSRDQEEGLSISNGSYALAYNAPATVKSWSYPFEGDAADALWEHIIANFGSQSSYAHYAAFVQSSGMGKSRTMDELAKYHFVIPLNLREADSTGISSSRRS